MTHAPEPAPIDIAVDPEVVPLVCLGLVQGEPVAVGPAAPPLVAEMEALRAELAARHGGRSPSEIAGLLPARDLYRAFGIDPTRTRPSSEALLRRILLGKPLPRILNAVDVCNLCSLRFLLPIGLYDAERLLGPTRLRRGLPGESFQGIRKDDVHLGGRPTLADDAGAFGNPSSDSLRTSVAEGTRSLFMVVFAPADYPAGRLGEHVAFARAAMERHLAPAGGSVATRGMTRTGH
jgi:DNA/RNA-binding domain of Phe-tRNA-synthetase-like protein